MMDSTAGRHDGADLEPNAGLPVGAPFATGAEFLRSASVHIEGQGRPLLLINGLLHGHETWEPLVRHFAPHRRTIRFDFPHQNNSSLADSYDSFERYCDFVQDLLDALDLDPAETEAFGFSIGGDVLRTLAVHRGVRFRHVVMGASAPPGIERFWKEFFGSALNSLRRGHLDTFTHMAAFQFYSPLFIQSYPKLLNVMHFKCLQRFPDLRRLEALLHMPLARRSPDPACDIALRSNTTLIHCLYDQLVPIALAREYARQVGLPLHEVETGHTLLAEAPDEVARLVMEILGMQGRVEASNTLQTPNIARSE